MKKIVYISIVSLLAFACSPLDIQEARVLTQEEIDEHNSAFPPIEKPDPAPEPSPEDLTNVFVSVSGTGDKSGKDVGNSMDIATLRSFLQSEQADGKTVHFANGVYTLSEEANGLELSRAITLHFVGGDETVLDGLNSQRILTLGGNVNLTLENMKLTKGYSTTKGGAIMADACMLSMKNCIVEENKTSTGTTKNSNNGGAIYLGKDMIAAEFVGCHFINNKISTTETDQWGGAVRIDAAQEKMVVDFDQCLFEGNFAKQAACISVNAKTILRLRQCTFLKNSAQSRGMIQMAGCVVFMDGCQFYENTTSANNGWGVDMHGKGYICMNNCTLAANSNKGTNEKDNNVAINGYHSLLMTRCKLVENNRLALLRIDAEGKQVFCENLLLNTSGKTAFTGNTKAKTVSMGYNVFSKVIDYAPFTPEESDKTDCTEEGVEGVYENYHYSWNPSLIQFTQAPEEKIQESMNDQFDIALEGVMEHIGPDFYSWINGK